MELTKEEERALNGEFGEGIAKSYRILVAIGEALNAERLININWAHVSGVNYNTIGDAGLRFLEDLVKEMENKKVVIKTTINPMGYDPEKKTYLSEEFVEKQTRIIKAYEKLGILGPYTCIPYEVFQIPTEKTQVSFAESNAAVFANSILNLYTNKESALSALASAITGKAPYSSLRKEELRKPKAQIDVKFKLENELDFGLLGYFAGKIQEPSLAINLIGGSKIEHIHAKALCASLGLAGSAGMFKIGSFEDIKERIEFTRDEAKDLKDKISNADDGDLIVFGSPQWGMKEIEKLANLLENRKFRSKCILFCERGVYNKAKKLGIADKLERANVEIYCDSCSCLTPLINKREVDSVITNSVKAAYYLRNWNGVKVALKDMEEIIREKCK